VLVRINQILRGWTNYFRYAACKRTLSRLFHFVWWRVIRWFRALHRWRWKDVRRRFTTPDGRWKPIEAEGITLFNPASVPVTRYRYRGTTIPNPWTVATTARPQRPWRARCVEYAEPRIMPSRWSLRLVRRLAVVWIFGIIWAAVRVDAVFRRGRVLRWRRRDHEQAVTIAGVGVGAAAGLCGGFPRGVVNAGVFGAFGRRASAADGAFKSVAGRNRFGPRRIDPVAG